MHIVVLGDCQSNGNNCLMHEIAPDRTHCTWSLRYHNEYDVVFKWMLKKIAQGSKLPEVTVRTVEDVSWAFLRREEKAVAWPALLTDHTVYDYSINGAHFIGYLKRLQQHVVKHGKPDLVIITDYSPSHVGVVFKDHGQRYVFESVNYDSYVWKTDKYSPHVRDVYFKRLDSLKRHDDSYHYKRHRHYYRLLQQYLDQNNIQSMTVRFGTLEERDIKAFDEFMSTDVDCTEEFKEYTTREGEHSLTKLQLQQTIAAKIKHHLPM